MCPSQNVTNITIPENGGFLSKRWRQKTGWQRRSQVGKKGTTGRADDFSTPHHLRRDRCVQHVCLQQVRVQQVVAHKVKLLAHDSKPQPANRGFLIHRFVAATMGRNPMS